MSNVKSKIIWLALVFVSFLILFVQSSYSQSETEKRASELQQTIEEYQRKLSELRVQKDTLSAQIQYMDTQIFLTTLKIQETEEKIKKTEEEIETLTQKIDGLNTSLDYLTKILLQKIVEGYKRREVSFFDVLLDAENATVLTNRLKYLKISQDNDRRIAFQMQQAKNNFEDQKKLREEKKIQLAQLKVTLNKQKNSLAEQKKQKEYLLIVTKNDEERYQRLLQAAKVEQEALAIQVTTRDGKLIYTLSINGLSNVGGISAGSSIGTMGNTGYPGCSTGAHLHFGTLKDAKIEGDVLTGELVSPLNYLSAREVGYFDDNNNLTTGNFGSGSWPWPLNTPIITQLFGKTKYSSRYRSGLHDGVDMVDLNNYSLIAPASGTLYKGNALCNSSSSLINVAIIDHGGGVTSYYLHLK